MAKRRARNADGTFVADNPATPQDEAWEEVPADEVAPVSEVAPVTVKSFGYVAGRQAAQQVIEEIPAQ